MWAAISDTFVLITICSFRSCTFAFQTVKLGTKLYITMNSDEWRGWYSTPSTDTRLALGFSYGLLPVVTWLAPGHPNWGIRANKHKLADSSITFVSGMPQIPNNFLVLMQPRRWLMEIRQLQLQLPNANMLSRPSSRMHNRSNLCKGL